MRGQRCSRDTLLLTHAAAVLTQNSVLSTMCPYALIDSAYSLVMLNAVLTALSAALPPLLLLFGYCAGLAIGCSTYSRAGQW
jgi:hypothetical protein